MKDPLLDAILEDLDDPAEQAELRETWDRLGQLERAEPSPELARRFARTIESSRAHTPRSPSFPRPLLTLAAVLAVGIAIGVIATRLSLPSRDAGLEARASRMDADRLSRAVSVLFESHPLAARRLEAVETLAGLPDDPEIGRILTEVASSDRSVGVRLVAIDAIGPYVDDDEVARRLIDSARSTDSELLRIRLIELFVDHRVDTARPTIESLHRDPRVDEIVRETARWAIHRLQEQRSS